MEDLTTEEIQEASHHIREAIDILKLSEDQLIKVIIDQLWEAESILDSEEANRA